MKIAMSAAIGLFLLVSFQVFAAGLEAVPSADNLPGEGITVQPVDQGVIEEVFQLEIVIAGLKRLGYQVKPSISLAQVIGMSHLMVAQGEADFYAAHWDPLHDHFFEKVGGEATLYRIGSLVKGATQGYLIDKKTADRFNIRSIDRMKDPEIAALFDIDADGRADLVGCHRGWGCFNVIENHLDTYRLRDAIEQKQDNYFEMIDAAIARFKAGKPIFYYTWTPQWINGVMVPGKDVQWLSVPDSDASGAVVSTGAPLPNGSHSGFETNAIRILANKTFIDANPAVKRLFEIITIPINDISAENLKIRSGERRTRDIRRHAREWIQAHQAQFDTWISNALRVAQ